MNRTKGKHIFGRKAGNIILFSISIIFCIIFAFLFLCNMGIIIKSTMHPDEPPTIFGITPLVVMSDSMNGNRNDSIKAGDLIFIDKVKNEELEVGNIIAYKSGSAIVTHRIKEIKNAEEGKKKFITKGDANNAEDNLFVKANQVVGIFKYCIPGLGKIILFMQSPLGMFISIGIPFLIFLIYDGIYHQIYVSEKTKRNAEIQRLHAITDNLN